MKARPLIAVLCAALGLLILAGGAAAYFINIQDEAFFVQKFKVDGIDFSEQDSFESAISHLKQERDGFLDTPVLWLSNEGRLTGSLRELGLHVDTQAAEAELRSFMEDSTPVEKVRLALIGKTLDAELSNDEFSMKNHFWGTGFIEPAQNARFQLEGEELIIVSEQSGSTLDTEAMQSKFKSFWKRGSAPELDELIITQEEPRLTVADLEAFRPKVDLFLDQSLILHYVPNLTWDPTAFGEEFTWEVPLLEHLDWLEPNEDGIALSEEAFMAYLEQNLGPELERDPTGVVIREDAGGGYAFEGSARFGLEIDRPALAIKIEEQLQDIMAGQTWDVPREFDIPMNRIDPSVTVPDSLADLGVNSLLGYGYSNFTGSPTNRVHNIKVGMNIFDGSMIAPGEEFSFTQNMGPIDAAHGWKAELVIKGNDTIPEFGGGLCQVSSTLFRAALFTGQEIVARQNHSYAVSYYANPMGHGLDATIYDPNPDFVFKNDTPGHVLVQGYTDGTYAYFVMYGSYDERIVHMDGPYSYGYHSNGSPQITYTDSLAPGVRVLEEYAHTGFKVDWYRDVTYGDGSRLEREHFHSSYRATPNKYLEGRPADGGSELGG